MHIEKIGSIAVIAVSIIFLVYLFIDYNQVGVYKSSFVQQTNVYYFRLDAKVGNMQGQSLTISNIMSDADPSLSLAQQSNDAHFFLFETLNNIDQIIGSVKYPQHTRWIYGLGGTDYMVSKSAFSLFMREPSTHKYIPDTYVLSIEEDRRLLAKTFDKDAVYILKKNIQRQEGCFLTSSLEQIMSSDPSYVVVQKVLQDPYILNGHKINLRVYLLIVINTTSLDPDWYVFNNGFMYYTPLRFKPQSLEKDRVITTGYINRTIYEHNPLSLEDLASTIGPDAYALLQGNIMEAFTSIKQIYDPILVKKNASLPGTKFLIYGCDVAPDKNLNVKIMEINKGPDLTYKDGRDKQIKVDMMKHAFEIVGISQGSQGSQGSHNRFDRVQNKKA